MSEEIYSHRFYQPENHSRTAISEKNHHVHSPTAYANRAFALDCYHIRSERRRRRADGDYQQSGLVRVALLLAGAALLLGYGSFVNIAPVEFGRIVGLYIATLFVVWQIINFLVFQTLPGLPVWLGGALVIAGGLIITFWRKG